MITNSLGMKMVRIPAGKFMMGSPEDEKGRFRNERRHEVIITRAYYLGTTQVTQSQYERVMGENPSYFSYNMSRFLTHDTSDFPVEKVPWDDAIEFCKRLSEDPAEKAEGRSYRLPTEAEWEYACRAGSTTTYSFGDNESQLEEYAWYNQNSGERTHAVGQKKPNAWGLYDMHGNVWEWCVDLYRKYSEFAVTNPVADQYDSHAIRGGGWSCEAKYCRSAFRSFGTPRARYNSLGLRVALDLFTVAR